MRASRVLPALLALVLLTAACGLASDLQELPDPPNLLVATTVHPGLLDDPRLRPDAAVSIGRDFLARMRPIIAAPELHVVASFTSADAVQGTAAWSIDPCIPKVDDATTVWVLRGEGDFLNLVDFVWSRSFGQFDEGFDLACRGAERSGTIVVDDTTGYILGVYPGDHAGLHAPDGGASIPGL
jgi:hypothetical protein